MVSTLVGLILLSVAITAGIACRLGCRIETSLSALIDQSRRIGRSISPRPNPFVTTGRDRRPGRFLRAHAGHLKRRRQRPGAQPRRAPEEKVSERTSQLARKSTALADQLLFIQVLLDTLPNPVFWHRAGCPLPGLQSGLREKPSAPPAFLVGKTVLELPFLPPELRAAHHDNDLQTIATAGTSTSKCACPSADGATRHPVLGQQLPPGNGELGGLLGVLVDISAQKEADAKPAAPTDGFGASSNQAPSRSSSTAQAATCCSSTEPRRRSGPAPAGKTGMQRPGQLVPQPGGGRRGARTLRDGHPVRDQEIEFRAADGTPVGAGGPRE